GQACVCHLATPNDSAHRLATAAIPIRTLALVGRVFVMGAVSEMVSVGCLVVSIVGVVAAERSHRTAGPILGAPDHTEASQGLCTPNNTFCAPDYRSSFNCTCAPNHGSSPDDGSAPNDAGAAESCGGSIYDTHRAGARVIDRGWGKRYSLRQVGIGNSCVYVQIPRSVTEDVILVGVNGSGAVGGGLAALPEALPRRLHQARFHLVGSQRGVLLQHERNRTTHQRRCHAGSAHNIVIGGPCVHGSFKLWILRIQRAASRK